MSTVRIRAAHDNEARTVLRMVLALPGQSAGNNERQVSSFIEYTRALSLSLDHQWVAEGNGPCVSACTCLESPGRTALLFLPSGLTSDCGAETIGCLLEHVLCEISTRDIRLVQCLIAPTDEWNRAALALAGFRELATLRYMECDVSNHSTAGRPAAPPQGSFEWVTYDRPHHADFARLILATYEDSQDCRGLAGIRGIEDILAGHKAAGRFEPHRWRLLYCDRRPAACILFVENPLRPALELVYVGVHPEFRRRGIGGYVLDYGLSLAQREQFSTVTLAVDAANTPAERLYDARRFRQTLQRRAMIRVLDSSP